MFIKKLKELKKHNEYYYDNDNPKISDAQYDDLKKEILNYENKYDFLEKTSSKIVGTTPSNKFKKIRHLIPMLSLSNAFEESDMRDFIKKLKNF